MPNHIFISYGYNNTAAYYTVEKWLNEAMKTAGFSWTNCSAPNDIDTDNSDDNADRILDTNNMTAQIANSSILIVVSDMYHQNKKFIDFQIDTAKRAGKYIIALKRWRNLKPVPRKILKNADEIINLCCTELINSIKKYCCHYDQVNGKELNHPGI